MYKQGEIVAVKFPFTDGSQFKKRPVLIVSNNLVNQTGDYLVIQITSKYVEDDLSILINNFDCDVPLPLKSYVRTHKIFTVNETLILSKITNVNIDFLKVISKKITDLVKV